MVLKRVVVTGLGALTPIGNNIQEYWNGLINGVSGAATITHYDASKHKTQFACEVKNFNAEEIIDRIEFSYNLSLHHSIGINLAQFFDFNQQPLGLFLFTATEFK